jgi:hypothetical protein
VWREGCRAPRVRVRRIQPARHPRDTADRGHGGCHRPSDAVVGSMLNVSLRDDVTMVCQATAVSARPANSLRSASGAARPESGRGRGNRWDHSGGWVARLSTRRQRPRCRRAPVCRWLWAGSTRVNLVRVCDSLDGPMGGRDSGGGTGGVVEWSRIGLWPLNVWSRPTTAVSQHHQLATRKRTLRENAKGCCHRRERQTSEA